jgi:hypothetical protein
MEQFVALSERPAKRILTVDSARNWFNDAQLLRDTDGVIVSIIDTSGVIHSGKFEWLTHPSRAAWKNPI